MKKDYRNLLRMLGKNKKRYILLTMLELAMATPVPVIRAHSFKLLIDYFVYKGSSDLTEIIILLGVTFSLSFFIIPITAYFSQRITEVIMRDMRIRTFMKVKQYPVEYFEKFHSGDILARLNRDVDTVKNSMNIFNNFFFHAIAIMVKIPYFVYLDYRLAIFVTVTSLISTWINLKFVQPIRDQTKDRNKMLGKMSEVLTENVTGFRIIKMFGLKKHFTKKLDNKMDEIYDAELKFVKTESKMRGINSLAHIIFNTLVVIFTAYLVIIGEISPGTLVGTTMLYYSLSFHFMRIGQNIANVQKAFAGLERVDELFSEEEEPERYQTDSMDISSGVSIKSGKFGYDKKVPVLNGVDIVVPKGHLAALVGNSGGGKSTLVKIILGQYELDSGQMTVNQKPVNQYTLDELRAQSAYVPQDAYIFNGTIRENIMYGHHDASEEEMMEASKKANAHQFIMKQVNGYDTLVGEKGIKLSGGQRQRIAISRAILKNAPILLLDEATSSLDSESEHLVQQALDTLMQDKTSVVVAHRLSTIEHANIIYFIKEGRVIEEGTHSELLEKSAHYAELYYREFAS
ncbi:MAG: ABC transporter ATP-binding protein [Clostridiales bacterium]|nr:ABC transporter ATP-binding protein [Clostridiales bacterium]